MIRARGEKMKYRSLTLTALYAAIICILSPWVIPLSAVPITLGSFAVYVVSGVADLKKAFAAVGIYIILGAVGLPVFSGFQGGFQVVAGPTGGFIVGYLVMTLVICLLKGKIKLVFTYCIGTIALYAVGTAWYMVYTGAGVISAMVACVAPFLAVDAIKIALACGLVPKLKIALKG